MGKDSVKMEGLDFTGVLQTLGLQQSTGTLRVDSADGSHYFIYLEKGKIVGADAFPKRVDERLGNILVVQGHLTRDQLLNVMKLQKATKRKLGQVLIRYGFVDKKIVEEALRRQIMRIFFKLYGSPIKKYVFDHAESLDEDNRMIPPIPVENFILEIATIVDELPMIRKAIPRDDMIFEISPDYDPSSIELSGSGEDFPESPKRLSHLEYHILNLIDGITPVERILMLSKYNEFQSLKAMWSLRKKGIIIPTQPEEEIISAIQAKEEEKKGKFRWVFFSSLGIIAIVLFGFFISHLKPFYTYFLDFSRFFVFK